MSLAGLIIEHGPYEPYALVPNQVMRFVESEQLNHVRDELIELRRLRTAAEAREQCTVEAYGTELALTCNRCGWTSWPREPIHLADLVRRADEHTEGCRQ